MIVRARISRSILADLRTGQPLHAWPPPERRRPDLVGRAFACCPVVGAPGTACARDARLGAHTSGLGTADQGVGLVLKAASTSDTLSVSAAMTGPDGPCLSSSAT
jgi:hypothetical protein